MQTTQDDVVQCSKDAASPRLGSPRSHPYVPVIAHTGPLPTCLLACCLTGGLGSAMSCLTLPNNMAGNSQQHKSQAGLSGTLTSLQKWDSSQKTYGQGPMGKGQSITLTTLCRTPRAA